MPRITSSEVVDVRFPTSLTSAGSDAMNPDSDYSAAYVVLSTDDPELSGYGLTFTIGRGTDLCVSAARQVAAHILGLDVDEMLADMGAVYRRATADSQLRWLGPEKGVVHLALAAVLNAAWDMVARRAGKPLWRLLVDMTAEQLVDVADLRYLSDALTRDEAIAMLEALEPTLADDIGRCAIAREVLGPDRHLLIDANQVWDVPEAIAWVNALRPANPLWIEEPTSPDDVLGHAAVRRAVAPVWIATGEHCHNRVMFKQFLQAGAIDVGQIDACRLASVNEVVSVLLLAAKYGVPVCPHAGGVGLCELVQHLSIVDYVAFSGSLTHRVTEYVDHLHEHFVDPCVVENAAYVVPTSPGYSARMVGGSVATYRYPDGRYWRDRAPGRPAAPRAAASA